jgi:signal transduction histidine kinase
MGATAAHVTFSTGVPNSIRSTLGALIALFTVAERYERRQSVWALLITLCVLGAIIVYRTGMPAGLGGLVQTTVAVVVAWVLGTWSRERRTYVGVVEERAAAAERRRDEDARRAVSEERERIAREMHDVVTHHVSVMVIQSGAAERALRRRPEDALQAISAIGVTGRQALADMRIMLGILGPVRTEGEETSDVPEPMPRLDRLGELIESVRAAGLPVELTVSGERQPMHPGVELSAYRIIQEALTNTLKHAHGARSFVSVRFGPSSLELSVRDEGGSGSSGIAGSGRGRGLIGMRERVAVFGGEFRAGPIPGGFGIEALLPLDVAEAR